MSRSRRHTPIVGMTNAASDKPAKVSGHRRTRAVAREMLARGDESPPPVEITENPWRAPKDGKQWLGRRRPELLRK